MSIVTTIKKNNRMPIGVNMDQGLFGGWQRGMRAKAWRSLKRYDKEDLIAHDIQRDQGPHGIVNDVSDSHPGAWRSWAALAQRSGRTGLSSDSSGSTIRTARVYCPLGKCAISSRSSHRVGSPGRIPRGECFEAIL